MLNVVVDMLRVLAIALLFVLSTIGLYHVLWWLKALVVGGS